MDKQQDEFICHLCYECSVSYIEIHGQHGKQLAIEEILSKHFGYGQFSEEDSRHSKLICTNCWQTVADFNRFYVRVEAACHAFYRKTRETFLIAFVKAEASTESVQMALNVERRNNVGDNLVEADNLTTELNVAASISELANGDDPDDELQQPDSDVDDGNVSDVVQNETAADASDDSHASLQPNKKSSQRAKTKTLPHRRKRNYLTLTVRPTQITTEDYIKIHKHFDMTCDYCTHKVNTIEEARLHYRKEHNVNGYLKCCNQQFKYPKDIFNHVEWHGNPLVNQCEVCNKVFKTAKAKTHHILVHSVEKNFGCDFCFKQFARKFLLDNHLRYYCTETKHQRLKKTIQRASALEADTTNGTNDDNNSTIMMPITKKKRLMTTDLIDKSLTNVKIKSKKQPQQFVCDLCGRIYTAKTSLEYHQINHHQDAEKQKVQCNICHGWYVSKYIKRHITQHNDTSVACTVCQKPFKNQKNLKAHMKNSHLVSEAERRLACHICDKRFLYPFHLKQHMISHTGGSLYKCGICSKEFSRGRLYRLHKKTCYITDPLVHCQSMTAEQIVSAQNEIKTMANL